METSAQASSSARIVSRPSLLFPMLSLNLMGVAYTIRLFEIVLIELDDDVVFYQGMRPGGPESKGRSLCCAVRSCRPESKGGSLVMAFCLVFPSVTRMYHRLGYTRPT